MRVEQRWVSKQSRFKSRGAEDNREAGESIGGKRSREGQRNRG